jgi:hypothetical protein
MQDSMQTTLRSLAIHAPWRCASQPAAPSPRHSPPLAQCFGPLDLRTSPAELRRSHSDGW